MKCKKCGYSCSDINSMRKHYQKQHPGAMKAKGPRRLKVQRSAAGSFCPYCGGRL